MAELRDANTNPWYVLMTLYGEQEGKRVDRVLAEKNRYAWNVWALQLSSTSERAEILEAIGWRNGNANAWDELRKEIASDHQAEMERRNPVDFQYPGLPNINEEIDLTELVFKCQLDISQFVFMKSVDFYQSRFVQRLSAKQSYYRETAKFQFCNFHEIVEVVKARFLGPAEFYQANFEKAFYGTSATYRGLANFTGARFSDVVEMSDIVFSSATHFVEAEFQGGSGKKRAVVNFNDTIFEKPANFRQAHFEFQYPTSSGCVFHADSSFSAQEAFWPDPTLTPPDTAKEFCAKVRVILSKQGFVEEEHALFRREMEFSRLATLVEDGVVWPYFKSWPYWIFKKLSNYGESIARPSLALLALWVVPALILLGHFAWVGVVGESKWSGLDAWGLSFANIFTVFGFHRLYFDAEQIQGLHWFLQLMGALQTVFALPLLFFLGLALRKRFRLR